MASRLEATEELLTSWPTPASAGCPSRSSGRTARLATRTSRPATPTGGIGIVESGGGRWNRFCFGNHVTVGYCFVDGDPGGPELGRDLKWPEHRLAAVTSP